MPPFFVLSRNAHPIANHVANYQHIIHSRHHFLLPPSDAVAQGLADAKICTRRIT